MADRTLELAVMTATRLEISSVADMARTSKRDTASFADGCCQQPLVPINAIQDPHIHRPLPAARRVSAAALNHPRSWPCMIRARRLSL